ncbi:MAG: glycosyltransferase family 4 protein [Elusimicrobiota bacterium]
MKKPAIGIIHYSAPPVLGSVEAVIEKMCRMFSDNGYRTTLIVARGGRKYRSGFYDIKRIKEINSQFSINQNINERLEKGRDVSDVFSEYSDRIFKKLDRVLGRIDICLMHNVLVKDLNFPLAAAIHRLADKYAGSKTFVNWVHDASYMDYRQPYWYDRKDEFPYKFVTKHNTNIVNVAVSPKRQADVSEMYNIPEKEVAVIPNGIDIPKLVGMEKGTEIIWEANNLYEQDAVIFIPARIVHKKNIELGIRLTEEMNRLGVLTKLVVSGRPSRHMGRRESYYTKIKELIAAHNLEDVVIFLHEYRDRQGRKINVSDKMIRDLYIMSDVLLFASYEEGFGLPVLEASVFKTPIICSKIPPLTDFAGYEILYINPKGKPRRMAKKVIDFLSDYHGFRFRRNIFRKYRWDSIFRKHIEPFILRIDKDRKKV